MWIAAFAGVEGKIRVLVVDGSQLMGWLVDSLTPESVDVRQTTCFAEAKDLLITDSPDAAIFNIGPSDLPWGDLHAICDSHDPRIPYLCCSAVEDLPAEKLDMYCADNRVLIKPIPMMELREHVLGLAEEARKLQLEAEDREGSTELEARTRPSA